MDTNHASGLLAAQPYRWFIRGFAVGVLVVAALNAGSYFLRSEHFGNLIGTHPEHHEALGFPVKMWEDDNPYDGYFIDLTGLAINVSFGFAIASLCGYLVIRSRAFFNRIVARVEAFADLSANHNSRFQVSLAGLFVATGIAAAAALAVRGMIAGRPEVLAGIYLAGPWVLVAIAYLPIGLAWQQRVAVIVPCTILLMLGAIAAGMRVKPPVPFDKVLLGIFICWTPQTILAATIHSIVVITQLARLNNPD